MPIVSDAPDVFVAIEAVRERRVPALRRHMPRGRDQPRVEPFRRIAGALGWRGGCRLAEGHRRQPPS